MNKQSVIPGVTFNRTVLNWRSARPVFSAFIAAHPELGLKDTPITFRNFCYRHGDFLRKVDVMRKPSGIRSSAIVDINRFDEVVFNLMSRGPIAFDDGVQPTSSLDNAVLTLDEAGL